ncbi:MAG: ATP-binding protein [bacterium]|nr:ATP-binding protein [bacterium]
MKKLMNENTLLKEEYENLKSQYEKCEKEQKQLTHVFCEMSMGVVLFRVVMEESKKPADLIFEYANNEFLECYYNKDQEILEQSVKEVIPRFSQRLLKVCGEVVSEGNRMAFIEFDEAEETYIKITCYAVGEDRCACIFVDVTDSFLAEKMIQDSEERYHTLSMARNEIVFELDVNGQFIYISEGILKVLGYEAEEFLGKYYYELFPVEAREKAIEKINQMYEKPEEQANGSLMQVNDKQGIPHWMLLTGVFLYEENGECIGYRGAYLEVTHMEQQKLDAEAALANSANILAKMSHEIRTPLSGMIGLASLALEEPRTYKVYNYLEKIEESAVDLLEVINNILEYSKIAEEEIKVYEEAFSLKLVIQKVITLLNNKAVEKDLRLIVEIEEHVPDTYSGDSLRLQQVLMNLLGNAVKYTMMGYVKLIVRKRDKGLLFIVKDSGTGMSEDFVSHIFDPFSSQGQARKKGQNGTGLGMLISKELIEAMGGRIKVFSKENEGTKVYFALPLKQCKQDLVRNTEVDTSISKPPCQYKGDILVVEENSTSQMVLCELLERFGVNTTVVKDGYKALSLVKNRPFDLIIMDLYLPKLSGWETSRRIRNLKKDIPIIAMTANTFEEVKEQVNEGQMSGCLTKPVNQKSIEYILQKYLQFEGPYQEEIASTVELGEAKKERKSYPFKHIDYVTALKQLDNDYYLYNKIVFNFIKEYQKDLTKINQLIRKEQKEARLYVHTIKGLANTIGAFELAKLAQRLEGMIIKDNVDKNVCLLFTTELKLVNEELIPYAQSIRMTTYKKGFQRDKAEQLLDRLEKLILSHSANAVDETENLYRYLYREDLIGQVNLLITQIEHYDFEIAKQTLEKTRQLLGVEE